MKFLRDPLDRSDDIDPSKSALGCLVLLALVVLGWQMWEMAHSHGVTWLFR